jgi:16S rRNA (adenine1518-N6/adenine1519-N6)-dimethyltransferase
VAYLEKHYPDLAPRIIAGDFLKFNPGEYFPDKFAIIGNFPYNISSQIFFRALEIRDRIPEIVCMLQKEVAQRIASPPGNKDYGILSVLLQAFYDIDYLVSVPPGAFDPPPKVNSGVIRLRRNAVTALACDEKMFFRVVKTAFNQRRKTLRNALKPVGEIPDHPLLNKRAEQLSVDEFVTLTLLAQNAQEKS